MPFSLLVACARPLFGTVTRDYPADSMTLLVIPETGTAICPQSAGTQPLSGVAGMAAVVVAPSTAASDRFR